MGSFSIKEVVIVWKCIYCKKEFINPAQRPEHIIFKSLGGRTASRTLVCGQPPQSLPKNNSRDCNNFFSEIERKFVNLPPLWYARAVLGLGRNKDFTAKFTTEDGKKVLVGEKGKIKYGDRVLSYHEEKISDTVKKISYTLADEEMVPRIRQQLERRGNVTNLQIKKDIQWQMDKKIIAEADFGTEEEYRAVAKLAFATLAYGANWIDVQEPQFDIIRDYILRGQKPAGKEFVWLDQQKIYTLLPVNDAFYNRVTIYCNPTTHFIVGYVEVLKHFSYSVLLAENYSGPRKAFQLLNLPLDKSKNEDEITFLTSDFHDIQLEDLQRNDEEFLPDKLQKAWSALGAALHEYIFRDQDEIFKFLQRVIHIAIENVGYPGKEYFELQDFFYITKFVTEKIKPFLRIDSEIVETSLLASFAKMLEDY
jgi:hypothetical protein